MKKFISFILSVVLMFGIIPTNTFAATTQTKKAATHSVYYSVYSYPATPHNYSSYMNKYYSYSVPGASFLEVKFSSKCKTETNCDFIRIYDSKNKLVGKYSGTQLAGKTLKISGSKFKINFKSDRTKNYYGFSIDTIYATKGSFKYFVPNVSKTQTSHNYSNNSNLSYKYIFPGANSLKVKFSKNTFTEKNYDYIYLYNSKGKQIGKYSGSQLANKTISISGSSFSIKFKSDKNKTYYGFKIDSIIGSLNSASSIIPNRSYSLTVPTDTYPESKHNYSSYLNENYSFRYPNAKSLSIKFSSKCKTEANCDFISIYDANNKLVGKYSGTQLAGKTVTVPSGSFRINLTTDRTKNYYGFKIDKIVATMHANPKVTDDVSRTVDSNVIYPKSAHSYANNIDQSYYYTDCYASSLRLKFTSNTYTEKNKDFIYIYDGYDNLIGKYSGDQLKSKFITVNGNSVRIRIVTNGSKTYYGYQLNYIIANYTIPNEGSNTYSYPESNHNYENYADNTYVFNANKDVKKLCVFFNKKTFTEQNKDFIYIYDSKNNLVGKYTGSQLAGKYLEISGNSFKIRLTSNQTKAYYGFKIDKIHALYKTDIYKLSDPKHNDILAISTRPGQGVAGKDYYVCSNCLLFREVTHFKHQSYTYSYSSSLEYNGKEQKPGVTISNGSTKLQLNKDYKLTYPASSKNSGYYRITVDFIGSYSGKKYLYYKISPYNEYKLYLKNQGFPNSYLDKLLDLHNSYPNWEFKPYKTNMNWQDAVNGERTPHSQQRIMIGENVSNDFYCYCSACTDKKGNKIVIDSSYAASEKAVKYYMDPRNWLDEKHIFQFETTNGGSGQTKSGVEAILKGTWMYNSNIYYTNTSGKSNVLYNSTTKYSDAIMKAASESGLSPYYIASKIKQEVGSSTASYAGGSNGTTAPFIGIYNYFNIGAYTGAKDGLAWAAGWLKVNDGGTAKFYKGYSNGAPTNYSKTLRSSQRMVYIGTYGDCFKVRLYSGEGGNSYSTGEVGYVYKKDIRKTYVGKSLGGQDTYNRPWTTPYSAIVNGSRYVYNNFGVYQYTGYLQKFNVTPNQTHSHEYMVNISSAQAEGVKIYQGYVNSGLLSAKHVFYIPVYNNM